MVRTMNEIDHDPYEPRIDRRPFPWWAAWLVVGLIWAGYLTYHKLDLWSLAVGGLTIGMLASWAIDKTGNRIPDSWKTRR